MDEVLLIWLIWGLSLFVFLVIPSISYYYGFKVGIRESKRYTESKEEKK